MHAEYGHVHFTVDGPDNFLVLDEPDVSKVLKKIEGKEDKVRKYSARFYTSRTPHSDGYNHISELQYRPATLDSYPQGLSFYSDVVSCSKYYEFEEEIFTTYPFIDNEEPKVEFGKPCEILALVIDIRGFSIFCEKPEIEFPVYLRTDVGLLQYDESGLTALPSGDDQVPRRWRARDLGDHATGA